MQDIKQKAIRGGFAKICAQALTFGLRIGSLMILGRLLEPKDFGLVGMVTAIIGVFNMFKDFGLSTATIQRATVDHKQHSTLFWVNILVGVILGLLVLAAAPFVATFYHDPRLFSVTAVLSVGFLFNAAGVQHGALLQRQLRFTVSAVIDVVALVASTAIGIGMALNGYAYWALVIMTIATPFATTVGTWLVTRWIPGRPTRDAGIASMLRFGGTITLNGVVVYLAYNLEKVLLGRYFGAAALGIYGRAYQLVNIPTDNLNSAAGGVAFPALARVQDNPIRLRSYFLRGYSLVLAITLPTTIICALLADDLIMVILGPKWAGTATVFRLLAPTISIFALINPLGWLLFATGMVGRSLKVALVLAPVVIVGYVIGLPYGLTGVATGYSAMMALWAIPHIAWCIHGTVVSLGDVASTVSRPLVAGIAAGLVPFLLTMFAGHILSPLPRLALAGGLFLAVYLFVLLRVMGQMAVYVDLVQGFRGRTTVPDEISVTA